jgi:hypothetical protein
MLNKHLNMVIIYWKNFSFSSRVEFYIPGLVSRVVEADSLVDDAIQTAQKIASMSQPIGSFFTFFFFFYYSNFHYKKLKLLFSGDG